jgi:hypothetical protein
MFTKLDWSPEISIMFDYNEPVMILRIDDYPDAEKESFYRI